MDSSMVFTVERREPELIAPAKPTPYELKDLSDIDNQEGLRRHVQLVLFFKNTLGKQGRDPVKVIRDAIAETLVYYYPLAGRLKEGPNDKLTVECSGEGVLFIEANANVRLDQFGDALYPPFPRTESLLYDVPGSDGILHCPLLLIQVTRLLCGGFIFAIRLNHTLVDGAGVVQFLKAVGEMARGAHGPSVQPIWRRELLSARDPPRVSCQHYVYHELQNTHCMALDQLAQRSFFFTSQEIEGLRNYLPTHLQKCTKFELLAACIWRCRTIALDLNSDVEVRLAFPVNARAKFVPPFPVGYYGNVIVLPVAQSSVGELCQNPFGYALELVKRAKADVTEEFVRSATDLMVQMGRPCLTFSGTFFASDQTSLGYQDIDFGWGQGIYAGPMLGEWPGTFCIPVKNNKGEDGIVLPIYLPGPAMERFVLEIEKMLRAPSSSFIVSPM